MIDGLHLSARHREALEGLLRSHLPGVEVWAYGSRANGAAHDGSDLDLVLRGSGLREIPARRLADFADAVRESSIPFLVEARDWARLPERFRREIEQGYVVLMGAETKEKNGWLGKNLGDCIEIANSNLSSSEKWSFVNYLDTGNITDNRISEIQRLVVGQDKIPSRARRKAGCGDIVYSTVRPNQRHYGLLRDIPRNFLVSTGFAVLRGRSGIAHTDFIYWFLTLDRVVDRLQTIAEHNTSAYPAIRPEDLELLPIDLPPLSEQQAIAAVLCALDDKIALNRRMNETLEAATHAIFEDWFVHFGPTRAKMEGREAYLAPEFWSLFPDRIDGATNLPGDWTLACLGNIAVSPNRAVDPTGLAGDTPYIGLEHMPRRSVSLARWDSARKITSQKKRFEKGEFLFGKLNPHFHKVGIAPCEGICSTDILVIRAISEEWSAFLLSCISAGRFVDFAARTSTGSTMPRTGWKALSRYQFAMPPVALATAYRKAVGPMLERIVVSVRESHMLADIRDALLPKLMSGSLPTNVGDQPPAEAAR